MFTVFVWIQYIGIFILALEAFYIILAEALQAAGNPAGGNSGDAGKFCGVFV